jgi:hypothetical protein
MRRDRSDICSKRNRLLLQIMADDREAPIAGSSIITGVGGSGCEMQSSVVKVDFAIGFHFNHCFTVLDALALSGASKNYGVEAS